MNAEEKTRYFQELTLNLQREGFAVKPETEEGLLPVELDGQLLCLARASGAVRYRREDAADEHRSAALDSVISIAKTTTEYMSQMEAAPQLTASGLTGDYRLLADFNGVVLAGHPKGLVSGRLVATDSTHVKANASRASEYLVEVQEEPGAYWERLDRYEEEGLAELERRTGKRRKKRTKQIKRDRRRTHKRVSRTDPEAGHMKRPGKSRGQYYLSHQTTDTDCGIITGVTVTPGDVYDSVPYLEQLEHIHRNVIPVQAATADSAYDFPLAHRVLEEQGITFFVRPQAAHDRTNVELKRDAFSYDIEQDAYG